MGIKSLFSSTHKQEQSRDSNTIGAQSRQSSGPSSTPPRGDCLPSVTAIREQARAIRQELDPVLDVLDQFSAARRGYAATSSALVPSAPATSKDITSIRRQGIMLPAYDKARSDRPPAYTPGKEECRLNVLSLDIGGERRTLAQLHSLKQVMEGISERLDPERNISSWPESPPPIPPAEPCDHFHIIAGSGAGGLVAIMLGRLRMGLLEVIRIYEDICDTVYSPRPDPKGKAKDGPLLSARLLEEKLKFHLKIDDSELLYNKEEVQTGNTIVGADFHPGDRVHRVLRSYRRPKGAPGPDTRGITIIQAMLATMAHPSLFEPAQAQGGLFVGPGTCCTPLHFVNQEAMYLFGGKTTFGLFLSVGAGFYPANKPNWRASEFVPDTELGRALEAIARDEYRIIEGVRPGNVIQSTNDLASVPFFQRLDTPWVVMLRGGQKRLREHIDNMSGLLFNARELLVWHYSRSSDRRTFVDLLKEGRPYQTTNTTETQGARMGRA